MYTVGLETDTRAYFTGVTIFISLNPRYTKGYASKGPWNHRYTPSITGWYSSPQDMIARREKTHASSPSTSGIP